MKLKLAADCSFSDASYNVLKATLSTFIFILCSLSIFRFVDSFGFCSVTEELLSDLFAFWL